LRAARLSLLTYQVWLESKPARLKGLILIGERSRLSGELDRLDAEIVG
jgi:hypothetical protein